MRPPPDALREIKPCKVRRGEIRGAMANDAVETRRGGAWRWGLPALALGLVLAAAGVYWLGGAETGQRGAVAEDHFDGGDVVFRDQTFFYVEMSDRAPTLQLVWRGDQGENLSSIGAAQDYMARRGRKLVFATHAGIHGADFAPLGLHVQDGEALSEIDLQSDQSGNFYLLPNGVFYLPKDGRAGIVDSRRFDLAPETLRLATQSGPLLVIDGALHPRFQEGSRNMYLRGGVGICDRGRLVFAMSREPVNFYDFASLFRDQLRCADALYLDGAITRMHAPELGQTDLGGRFVGILVATTPDD